MDKLIAAGLRQALVDYEKALEARGLAERTQRNYQQVSMDFVTWVINDWTRTT